MAFTSDTYFAPNFGGVKPGARANLESFRKLWLPSDLRVRVMAGCTGGE